MDDFVYLFRWLLGIPLLACSLYAAACNFHLRFIVVRRLAPEVRSPSPIVMVGALAGVAGLLLVPLAVLHAWAWLPLLLDVGALPLVFHSWLARWRAPRPRSAPASAAVPEPARYRALAGCLLGTAVGDAIGLPYEGLSRRRVGRWLRGPLRQRFFFGWGYCSDDTEHTCMVAQALLTARMESQRPWFLHVFAHNLAWRFRLWLLGLPAGIGLATLKAILKQWLHPLGHVDGVDSAGNGPAMRSAILGVCHGDEPALLQALVRAATRLTHTDRRAEEGAYAIAWAAHLARQTARPAPASFLRSLAGQLSTPDSPLLAAVAEVVRSVEAQESTRDFASRIGCAEGVGGFVMHTVPVALHAWLTHPEDYAAALETVVRCGGDTDTVGAIVGALVGTRLGPQGIPEDWLNHLREWPRSQQWLTHLALRLANDAADQGWRGALPLNIPGLLVRNILFMAWVLVHGFRRLLPPY